MTSFQLHIYLCEVEMQAGSSLAAANSVNECLDRRKLATAEPQQGSDAGPELGQAELFRSLHSFLTHAALVSRLLWPSTPRKRGGEDRASRDRRKARAMNRGKQIRLALGLPDEQPRSQRALRDHLEHLDERLDDWVLTSRRHSFVDHCVGPASYMFGPQRPDVMRWFDPTDGRFYLRGERFDLAASVGWVKEVRDRAEQARQYGTTTPFVGRDADGDGAGW